jgi:hypothetical protein
MLAGSRIGVAIDARTTAETGLSGLVADYQGDGGENLDGRRTIGVRR